MSTAQSRRITSPIKLFTIGFTQKSAEQFFTLLRDAGVKRLVDTRLNNVSQLAGFAKRRDLEYFLETIAGIQYTHETVFAPTKEMLTAYQSGRLSWSAYQTDFNQLLAERSPEQRFERSQFDAACLLCSEATADTCHRCLVAEYLTAKWAPVAIEHL